MSKTVITPEAILSYPHIFQPAAPNPLAEPVYSCSLVFPAGTDLSELREAALVAAREKWGDKANAGIKAGKIRMPFRTDAEEKGYSEGSVFLNVKSKTKPGAVSKYAGPDGKPMPIEDSEELYPGCRVRASLRAFAYDTNGNRGVSFGLNNIQKLGDGERIDGRKRAEDEFEALSSDPTEI
jgi:hypothetical protein